MRAIGWAVVIAMLAAPALAQEKQREAAEVFERCVKILRFGETVESYQPSKEDAVKTLGLLGDERAIPVLVEHFAGSKEQNLRATIVRALGWLKHAKAAPTLELALKDDYEFCRTYACEAFGELGYKRNAPAVEAMLRDKSEFVRAAAARSLGLLAQERSAGPLVACIEKETDPSVRFDVVVALRAIGSPASLPALKKLAEDPEILIKIKARDAIREIEGKK